MRLGDAKYPEPLSLSCERVIDRSCWQVRSSRNSPIQGVLFAIEIGRDVYLMLSLIYFSSLKTGSGLDMFLDAWVPSGVRMLALHQQCARIGGYTIISWVGCPGVGIRLYTSLRHAYLLNSGCFFSALGLCLILGLLYGCFLQIWTMLYVHTFWI